MGRCVGRPVAAVVLSAEERSFLERQVRRRRVARGMSDRCRIVLRCADGLTSKAVAAELGVHEHTVGKWRRRFLKDRVEGLSDAPRSGRPRSMEDARVAEDVKRTLETSPPDATLWSIRSMAPGGGAFAHDGAADPEAVRAATAPVGGVQALQPPLFVDKVRDIVGLYLAPPDRALAPCVDGENRGQALDREQPVLPMMPGMPERRTHNYVRHGTTSLFATLHETARGGYPCLHRPAQPESQAFQMDQNRRRYPRIRQTLLSPRQPHIMQRTLRLRTLERWRVHEKGAPVSRHAHPFMVSGKDYLSFQIARAWVTSSLAALCPTSSRRPEEISMGYFSPQALIRRFSSHFAASCSKTMISAQTLGSSLLR